jgi:hypothetical protein
MDSHPNLEVRIFNPFSRNVGRLSQFVTRMGSVTRPHRKRLNKYAGNWTNSSSSKPIQNICRPCAIPIWRQSSGKAGFTMPGEVRRSSTINRKRSFTLSTKPNITSLRCSRLTLKVSGKS